MINYSPNFKKKDASFLFLSLLYSHSTPIISLLKSILTCHDLVTGFFEGGRVFKLLVQGLLGLAYSGNLLIGVWPGLCTPFRSYIETHPLKSSSLTASVAVQWSSCRIKERIRWAEMTRTFRWSWFLTEHQLHSEQNSGHCQGASLYYQSA